MALVYSFNLYLYTQLYFLFFFFEIIIIKKGSLLSVFFFLEAPYIKWDADTENILYVVNLT